RRCRTGRKDRQQRVFVLRARRHLHPSRSHKSIDGPACERVVVTGILRHVRAIALWNKPSREVHYSMTARILITALVLAWMAPATAATQVRRYRLDPGSAPRVVKNLPGGGYVIGNFDDTVFLDGRRRGKLKWYWGRVHSKSGADHVCGWINPDPPLKR